MGRQVFIQNAINRIVTPVNNRRKFRTAWFQRWLPGDRSERKSIVPGHAIGNPFFQCRDFGVSQSIHILRRHLNLFISCQNQFDQFRFVRLAGLHVSGIDKEFPRIHREAALRFAASMTTHAMLLQNCRNVVRKIRGCLICPGKCK